MMKEEDMGFKIRVFICKMKEILGSGLLVVKWEEVLSSGGEEVERERAMFGKFQTSMLVGCWHGE